MKPTISSLGYLRIGVVSPEVRVADIDFNCAQIRDAVSRGREEGCRLFLFPELCVTAYTCGDLFFQALLIEQAREALHALADFSAEQSVAMVVGAPVAQGGRIFNCAVFISCGRIVGVVPKTALPNTQEFYEERWFSSSRDSVAGELEWRGQKIPFGADLLFRAEEMPECLVGIEICEDLWTVAPPSGPMALAGATLVLNPSASPEVLSKPQYRKALVQSQSARCLAAYAYAAAGPGESSTDLIYSGHSMIAENGVLLAESERFQFSTQSTFADVDIEHLVNERRRNTSFGGSAPGESFRILLFRLPDGEEGELRRSVPATPFVPPESAERAQRCQEIFDLQTTGLAKRLRHTGHKRAVIGISGGLDSTLALLVAVRAFDRLGLDRSNVVGVTMPGFGTTSRTRGNAERLAELLGITLRVVSIDAAVRQHFSDIGQDPGRHDVTYENSQARERTQILMNIANQIGGLVIGTGDLSELALGWCTYNGDHMSMYSVNTGVPKTLVRYVVQWCAEAEFSGEAAAVLADVCATPVSPELLPPDEQGEICQKTEESIGPYRLHDFFLYHVVRLQYAPAKVFFLACRAFTGEFDAGHILSCLKVFYRRFFSQQFKRSCLPDGPKVGSVVLSPRGDWRMPSDACVELWLKELEGLEEAP